MKAIMVKYNDGYYEPIVAATPEDWAEVKAVADSVTKIEDLSGWGEYDESYLVIVNGAKLVYFVANE